MGKVSAVEKAAEDQRRAVRDSLQALAIWNPRVQVKHQHGAEPFVSAYVDQVSIECPLAGEWFLTGYWRYRSDPTDPTKFVHFESSAGLNVSNDPHSMCSAAGTDSVCVARYDYDTRQSPVLHLNVFQPTPLYDRIHWRLPLTSEPTGWDADRVLKYLVKDTVAELEKAGWPQAA